MATRPTVSVRSISNIDGSYNTANGAGALGSNTSGSDEHGQR